MSKRKGRKEPLNSEITSVMRAPEELESEPAPAPAEADSEAPAADPELGAGADFGADPEPRAADALLDVADADSSDAAAPIEDDGAAAADSEPEAREAPAQSRRGRRLRAVRSRSGVAEGAAEDDSESDGHGDTAEPDRTEGAEEAVDAELGAAAARADDDDEDEDSGSPFGEPFSLDGYEGDDTEGFLRGLVEALLFTSQKPVDLKDLARSAGIDKPRARELVEQLQRSYEGRGLCIEEIAGGFVMRSAPRYAPYIQKILALRPVRLSRAQLETLAIVAYRQPVTKPEVDDIRGVDSGQVIKGLLERALLKMLGKKDEPGRPTLYGTTTDFLELLNLQSLKDLPTLREYTELSEESQRKFLDETGEAAPSEPMTFERPPSAELDESAGNEPGIYTEGAPEETSPSHAPQAETENGSAGDDADDDGAEGAELADEDEGDGSPSAQADESSEEDESDDDDDESDDDDDESDDDDDESDDDDDESDDDADDDDESDDDDDDDDESDDDSSSQDEDDDKSK